MKLSCNEIIGLCTKAARGAGLPLGHAEDIGQAAVWLAASGELDALCAALTAPAPPMMPEKNLIENACCVMAGPTVIDLVSAGHAPITLTNPSGPEVLAALAKAAPLDVTLQTVPDGVVVTQGDGQRPQTPTGPCVIPQATLDKLHSLAARTYVPATDASRNAGAGAGLTDND